MIDENLEKWESTLIASERRVLITNLVTDANDLAIFDDRMRMCCFRRTELLMDCKKSNRDDYVKPQGIVSKIVVPDSCKTETFDTNVEFENRKEKFSSETEHVDSHDADLHPDGVVEDGNLEQ